MENDPSIMESNVTANGTGFSRRQLLKGLTSAMVASTLLGFPFLSLAEKETATASPVIFGQFYLISQAITEHKNISEGASAQIFNAFHRSHPDFAAQVTQLHALVKPGQSAKVLQEAARQQGLGDLVTLIVTAWYTGTVGHGTDSILISYKDALMYRPVSDGLIVPTYCGNGPLYFTAAPPDAAMPESMNADRFTNISESADVSKA
ncbi:sorbitol dehydrogenase family protein [Rahnella rivi]|uniref:sorbitol dehydrogenase family protein n=1 Tax=Rahnella rivi TaxID=2816249 RepID=UPI0010A40514|nr:sorbitol dehydrogenase family protein [Rahnella rivi]MBU9832732.1 sorbitol dehydrogenase family protein [Rahnella rivi]THD55735.1 dehydrogenase [Enterobacteriaceae bacterium ML5]